MTTTDSSTGTTDALAPYMRVSSAEQKQQGTIENQRGLLDRYLRTHAITPYGTYEDDGVTGTLVFTSRPAGARLLADVRAGLVQTVLITKLDRFGRNAREILNAVHDLNLAGAQLVSLKENVDQRTIAGRFFLTVLAGVAEMERDMILEKTDEGMANRLLETTWMGGNRPLGYRVEGKRKSARLVMDDQPDEGSGYSESDAVRLAWTLLTEQDWPCERISDRLTELGIPTRNGERTGKGWAPNVVYQMFTNPVYKGERAYRAKDGTIITLGVPALVSVEAWDRAQATLARHRRSPVRSDARDYLLRGMMRCGLCGEVYTTSWTRRRDKDGHPLDLKRYYACSTRHFRMQHSRTRPGSTYPRDCHAVAVDAEWAETTVWAGVEQYVRNPGEALMELAARRHVSAQDAATQRAALAEIQQQLDALQGERDTIFTKYRKGHMSERDLDHQRAAMTAEETTLRAKQEALTTALRSAADTADMVEQARLRLQQIQALLDNGPLTPELKRATVEDLIVSIRVETVAVGLSARGRVKHRADLHVFYPFEEGMPAHKLPGSASAWR